MPSTMSMPIRTNATKENNGGYESRSANQGIPDEDRGLDPPYEADVSDGGSDHFGDGDDDDFDGSGKADDGDIGESKKKKKKDKKKKHKKGKPHKPSNTQLKEAKVAIAIKVKEALKSHKVGSKVFKRIAKRATARFYEHWKKLAIKKKNLKIWDITLFFTSRERRHLNELVEKYIANSTNE